MKFLVASVGNKLDSFVAKRFEHAAWYLIVDDETPAVGATQNVTPHDHNAILARAASENVDAVVAGKFSAGSLKLIRTHDLRVAHVHGISATRAIEKIESGEIKLKDEAGIEITEEIAVGTLPRAIDPRVQKKPFDATGFKSDSSRGHYHLQQYGGRGH
ncbi:MAG: NifB/NifX family molybdenum-iron cluster-binding protein [Bacteroidota bacterium]|jgi:predicted Fe-Mo cluster-binding NifX family protein